MTTDLSRLHHERLLAARGLSRIAGLDEAGRGPLAGPVVAAAVILPLSWILDGPPPELVALNDSKKLSATRRERFHLLLTQHPEISWALGLADVAEIDRLNILRASHEAMARALAGLLPPPDHLLIDGLPVARLPSPPQTAIIRGDSLSYSIAAASILAKVTRDRLMCDFDHQWPEYGFAIHKGYPTPAHLKALERLGPCPLHRRSFAPVAQTRLNLDAPSP